MNRRETEGNYHRALALARAVVETHLSAHLAAAGGDRDEALEDLAQSIVGTESVVRLIMTVSFDEATYEPMLVAAADEVGRAFFPDVRKRFVRSLDASSERLLGEAAHEEPPRAPVGLSKAAEKLPADLRAYFDVLTEKAGVDRLTSRLWTETDADALAGRLLRLRRHYPDGELHPIGDAAVDGKLGRDRIIAASRRVAAGLDIAFPWGFFAHQTRERSAEATRYLVETELRRTPEELLEEGALPFVAHGLGPALRRCGGSVNRLLALAFPGRVKPWMGSHVPPGYWDARKNRREAVRWLVESRLGLSEPTIAVAVHEGRLTKAHFSAAGLTWLIKNVYRWSVAEALAEAYPSLQPWERTRRLPVSTWEGDDGSARAANAIRWSLKRAGLSHEDLRVPSAAKLIRGALRPWHLAAAFTTGFKSDAVAALDAVFPGAFHPWEIAHMSRERWNDPAMRVKAVRWLLDRLGVIPAEIPSAVVAGRLTPDTFKNAGLDGLLRVTGSVWRAINDVFPGRFQRWELGPVPRSYWRSRANVRAAAEWVMKRLEVPDGAVLPALREGRLNGSTFVRLGLGSLLMGVFQGDLVALLQVADVLPAERYVPLSRYYRQPSSQRDERAESWRLHADRRFIRAARETAGSELERRVSKSRSIREQRRRRALNFPA